MHTVDSRSGQKAEVADSTPGAARCRWRSQTREAFVALALASVLPIAAAFWPTAVPLEIVLLALTAWIGLFVVAIRLVRRSSSVTRPAGRQRRAPRTRPRAAP